MMVLPMYLLICFSIVTPVLASESKQVEINQANNEQLCESFFNSDADDCAEDSVIDKESDTPFPEDASNVTEIETITIFELQDDENIFDIIDRDQSHPVQSGNSHGDTTEASTTATLQEIGISRSTFTITVTTADGSNKTATCVITVIKSSDDGHITQDIPDIEKEE